MGKNLTSGKAVAISAVIITYNEEKNILRCIESLEGIVSEIVVVDSFSNDRTKEICLEKKVQFFEQKFLGHIEQKNYAIKKANNQYILSLDADEALTPKLMKEILNVKKNWQYDGYTFKRLTNYCGHWVHFCGWYPDRKLRLFDASLGQWAGENPHDKFCLKVHTKIKKIKGNLLHYSYYTTQDHFKQIEKFTTIAAQSMFNKGKKFRYINLIGNPIVLFIKQYLFKLGIFDGYYGLQICVLSSYHTYLKYKKLNNLYKNHAQRKSPYHE